MKEALVDIFTLIRPKHYVKNLFIFLPLFFAGQFTDLDLLGKSFFTFISFSLSASSIYILNDLQDIEEDKQHPKKQFRPLASGAITKKSAIIVMFTLLIIGLTLAAFISVKSFLIILGYILLNITYSYHLKHISLLDITIIAIGFVLRLFVGSAVTNVPLSKWIVIMTFLLALFLALAKRRDDVLLMFNTGKKMRKVIGGYNLQLIDSAMLIMSSVMIVSYILYTTSIDVLQRLQTDNLYLTSLFVILGILRYLQITIIEEESGSPTKLVYKDKFIQLTLTAWFLSFVWILYF